MELNDKMKFVSIIQYLSVNFPERDITEDLVKSYFCDLSGFQVDDISQAARKYVITGKNFPFVSDLIYILNA